MRPESHFITHGAEHSPRTGTGAGAFTDSGASSGADTGSRARTPLHRGAPRGVRGHRHQFLWHDGVRHSLRRHRPSGHGLDGHPGWDVEFRVGAQVRAAADGIVQSVFTDSFINSRSVIQIQHQGGGNYRTVYTNVESVAAGITANAPVTAARIDLVRRDAASNVHTYVMYDGGGVVTERGSISAFAPTGSQSSIDFQPQSGAARQGLIDIVGGTMRLDLAAAGAARPRDLSGASGYRTQVP